MATCAIYVDSIYDPICFAGDWTGVYRDVSYDSELFEVEPIRMHCAQSAHSLPFGRDQL